MAADFRGGGRKEETNTVLAEPEYWFKGVLSLLAVVIGTIVVLQEFCLGENARTTYKKRRSLFSHAEFMNYNLWRFPPEANLLILSDLRDRNKVL